MWWSGVRGEREVGCVCNVGCGQGGGLLKQDETSARAEVLRYRMAEAEESRSGTLRG